MKKTILGLFLGMSVMGMAATTNVAPGTKVQDKLLISANVVSPLTMSVSPMKFKDILVNTAGVSMADTGVMNITGAKGNNVTIDFNKSVLMTSATNKKNTMKVSLSYKDSSTTNVKTINDNGTLKVELTGNIPASEATQVGQYTGSTIVSVMYN